MTRVRGLRWTRPFAAVALVAALAGAVALAPAALGHPYHPGADTPDTSAPGLQLDRVGGAFDFPVQLAAPRGDSARRFVVEQNGYVRLIKDGQTRTFLDLSDIVGFDQGERGLFSMAFSPDYATTRRFYVAYTDRGGDVRVDELKRSVANPDVADRASRRSVLRVEHSRYGNHNGGQLQFAADGYLYVSIGDGGGTGDPLRNGQNTGSLLGKILRIDPRHPSAGRGYSIPGDNPFVGRTGRDEIWAYGLRNPWRFSFDRAAGWLSIGDVGQDSREEVDFVRAGRRGMNFGWRCFEGLHRYAGCTARGHVPPALDYSHEGASCSVTGGYVLRDPNVRRLYAKYIYGDYCTGALHAATLREGQRTPDAQNAYLGLVVPRLTGFGEDAQGRLYMTSRSYDGRPGAVYRLRAAP